DCGMDQGPLAAVPGSHEGELFDQYDDDGNWVGHIAERDLTRARPETAQYLCGPAGSITLHNCRTVHGSPPNKSDLGRPLLLFTYSSADAFPYTANPIRSKYDQAIIRGQRAK